MKRTAENTERFIELRASGMTLAKAAHELDIVYNTAANWEKDLKEEIEAANAIKMEELLEKYRMTKKTRIELFGERLLAIQEELAKRDLSNVPTHKLFEMMIRCTKALEAEAYEPRFLTKEDIENRKRDMKLAKEKAELDKKFNEKFGIF